MPTTSYSFRGTSSICTGVSRSGLWLVVGQSVQYTRGSGVLLDHILWIAIRDEGLSKVLCFLVPGYHWQTGGFCSAMMCQQKTYIISTVLSESHYYIYKGELPFQLCLDSELNVGLYFVQVVEEFLQSLGRECSARVVDIPLPEVQGNV